MRHTLRFVLSLSLVLLVSASTRADETDGDDAWMTELGAIPIQHDGRIMPLQTHARQIASQITGRSKWSSKRGPTGFAGRDAIALWCDLMFDPVTIVEQPLIPVEDRGLKAQLGLDVDQRFFSGRELAASPELAALLGEVRVLEASDKGALTREHRAAVQVGTSLTILSQIIDERHVRLVPDVDTIAWRAVHVGDPGDVSLLPLQTAYLADGDIEQAVRDLRESIDAHGAGVTEQEATRVGLELWYNTHRPWIKSAMGYGLALVFLGCAGLWSRRIWSILAGAAMLFGVAEHVAGVVVRSIVLQRPPVSNTYESLLWMGLVAVAIGVIAQLFNRRGWYLAASLVVAELSVLFSMLVPLAEQAQALPPVLRSNYWLIVHVLVIVASYGVLTLGAVLGHAYLIRDVLLRRGSGRPLGSPLITQVYRTMQVGVLLLTAGTILGGVWAAESWGRFWGWDPKETWALISIIVYFAMLHARYVGWLRDPGLAVGSIVGFGVIVWTFYGVNYVMASGLHSYGFGSGGVGWLLAAAGGEAAFVGLCMVRLRSSRPSTQKKEDAARDHGALLPRAAHAS